MRKEHIIIGLMFAAVLSAGVGVYFFYFVPQLKIYESDEERVRSFDTLLVGLKEDFGGYIPEHVVAQWKASVQPWEDAVYSRDAFFNMGDVFEIEDIPEDVMYKFYYGNESEKLLDDLYARIRAHTPVCYCDNLDFRFGIPSAAGFTRMDKDEVELCLSLMKFGGTVVDELMDAGAYEIYNVVLWPSRAAGLLVYRTVGVSFSMTMEKLVKFLQAMRTANQYYSVDALQIRNGHLREPRAPQLKVRMLITQTEFDMLVAQGKKKPGAAQLYEAAAGPADYSAFTGGFFGGGRRNNEEEVEPSKIKKFLRWMTNLTYGSAEEED